MSGNLLGNPGFEEGAGGSATNWSPYGAGYTVDMTGGPDGSRALLLESATAAEIHGASQVIALHQSAARAVYFCAWSRASAVTGSPDSDYSLYLDVYYTDGTPLWGQTLNFDTGTHDWQFKEGFILPEKPIESISVYCLFRNAHTGTVRFDNLAVKELQVDLLSFDGTGVATHPPDSPPFGGSPLTISTADGLSLSLTENGGVLSALSVDGLSVADPAHAYASGFFVRDVAAGSDYWHVGGSLAPAGSASAIEHTAAIPSLGLSFAATYTPLADRILIHGILTDTTGSERAVTLYFALPLDADGWTWGDDIRTARPVSGKAEFANLLPYLSVGATGSASRYPWAGLAGPLGIAEGVPLGSPRICRLAYNNASKQFFAAFDLGLSPRTTKFPRAASVDLVLYRFDAAWGFRSAVQGFFGRYPADFARRIPPDREGIWVAFSDLSSIPNIGDFGIGIHELGSLAQVAPDEAAGICSFRYISEPWSHWLPINDAGVDPADYDQVVAYLQSLAAGGDARSRATLASGFFDAWDRYVYESNVAPWCSGTNGCAVFTLDPDPDVQDPVNQPNKANLDWNQAARDAYLSYPGLDGEYIDSFSSHTDTLDLRPSHFAAADIPLTFRTADHLTGIPELFATVEFARWLTADVHAELGRWTMANGILLDLPWGAELFDTMGKEVDWLSGGSFQPESDAQLSYARTLSGQRPYGLLMNTDFSQMSAAIVERYFQVCLFYGIYPGLFSHDAATDTYWDNPALYERDRPAFRRYIPFVRRINAAGWQPVTRAVADDPDVLVERFGAWPRLFLTLRNMASSPVPVTVTAEKAPVGLPDTPVGAWASVTAVDHSTSAAGPNLIVALTVDSQSTDVLQFYQTGDLNADGRVNVVDLAILVHHLAAPLTPGQEPFAAPLVAADMNRDGAVTAADAQALARLLAGG